MGGLTTLGIVHTVLALVALVSGFWALATDKEISPKGRLGQVYLATTFVTAATSLAIFRHGGAGPAHGLAVVTLVALLVGAVASRSAGKASRYVRAAAFSSTLLFHMIPGVTESLTRLPPSAPLLPSPDAPPFKILNAALLLLFVLGLALQIRWLRKDAQARP